MPALDQPHRVDTRSLNPYCCRPWACQTLAAQCWLRGILSSPRSSWSAGQGWQYTVLSLRCL